MDGKPATWTKQSEGVWVDSDGGLHIYVSDLLEANGYEATPENIRKVTAAAREMCLDLGAGLEEYE